jgi:hypothetical protein
VQLLAVCAVVLVTAYAFLAGPLFAWSPVKPGYDVLHLERADIYFAKGETLDPAFRDVDRYVQMTEKFHQLVLPYRVKIIVCRGWGDFHRFLPTVPGESVGAATPEFGTVIYITPKVRLMHYDPGEFVRHELSHAILEQNSSIWKSTRFKQAPWLLEGLGVLAGDQRAYGTWGDFQQRVENQSIVPLFSATPFKTSAFDLRFAYLSWRYFLAWMVETRGREVFQKLLTGFMEHPNEADHVFQEVYGEGLSVAAVRFETVVRSHAWMAH